MVPRFHEVESIFPVSFTFDWIDSESHDSDGRVTVNPKHVGTSLLGVLPLPPGLVEVRQSMTIRADEKGWDLDVAVTALRGRLNLITYKGSMLWLEDGIEAGRVDTPPLGSQQLGAIAAEKAGIERTGGKSKRMRDSAVFVDGFHDLVLFDGTCNLCNASVDFLLSRDVDQRLLFSAQQTPEAQAILKLHGHVNVQRMEDTVLVLGADGLLRAKSDAALRAGKALGGVWRLLATVASVVPLGIRDRVYDFVGRNRYRWFGRKETCRLPTLDERRRFL